MRNAEALRRLCAFELAAYEAQMAAAGHTLGAVEKEVFKTGFYVGTKRTLQEFVSEQDS